jgi:hypothetical protein
MMCYYVNAEMLVIVVVTGCDETYGFCDGADDVVWLLSVANALRSSTTEAVLRIQQRLHWGWWVMTMHLLRHLTASLQTKAVAVRCLASAAQSTMLCCTQIYFCILSPWLLRGLLKL